ncbi:MAG: lactate racemase domain-containing protein [Planctomycetes bacterium]|nr:lactate racemase domain-containing protein [Planctomycetota bacterium]
MQEVLLDYGDGKMRVELPDSAVVVRYGKTYRDPDPLGDSLELTRRALQKPLDGKPLRERAGPDKKVVVGFPDRVKGGVQPKAHRRVALKLILEELLAGGCELANITLLCGPGLHRQNTLEEFYWYLGKEIVDQFHPGRLINHDVEAPGLKDYGNDAMGNRVQGNALLHDADLVVMVGHCSGNPYGGYSGGYKMLVTGFSGWQSIASHHCPATMHRDDWLGGRANQHMRRQFQAIGKAMEEGMGKEIFQVDAVLGQFAEVLDVQAGSIDAVEKATWPLAERRTFVPIEMPAPADILVLGLPRNFHYGPGMGTNPILAGLALGGQLSRCWPCLRQECVVIAASIGDGWFNDKWFPSYAETYQALQKYQNPTDFLSSPDAQAITDNYEYRFSYSNFFTYHPFHAMSMLSGGAILGQRAAAVIMVGSRQPKYARGMGYIPVADFKEALKLAQRHTGPNPNILCTPECFSGGAAVHLTRK